MDIEVKPRKPWKKVPSNRKVSVGRNTASWTELEGVWRSFTLLVMIICFVIFKSSSSSLQVYWDDHCSLKYYWWCDTESCKSVQQNLKNTVEKKTNSWYKANKKTILPVANKTLFSSWYNLQISTNSNVNPIDVLSLFHYRFRWMRNW